MSLKNYSDAIAGVSPTILGVHRAADIVAAMTPPANAPAVPAVAPAPQSSMFAKAKGFAPGLVGAGVGAYAWKKHRILGAVLGHAAACSGLEFYRGDKKKALCDMAVEGAAVAGALHFKKSPVLGFVGGLLAGAAATYFVPGSPVRAQVQKRLK